jgi:hypothetical protein
MSVNQAVLDPYYAKYLKYKTKYLELQEIIGGAFEKGIDFLITVGDGKEYYVNNDDANDVRLPGWKLCSNSNKVIGEVFLSTDLEIQKKALVKLSKCQKKGKEMEAFIASFITNISKINLVENEILINETTKSVLIHLILKTEQPLAIQKYINKEIKPIPLVKNTSDGIDDSKYKLHKPLLPLIKKKLE